MKHYILAKYTAEVGDKDAALSRIRTIFADADAIEGVRGVQVYPCCVARENRYDVMIVLDMERQALRRYDESAMHQRWKDEFGGLLEKKAIFDHE